MLSRVEWSIGTRRVDGADVCWALVGVTCVPGYVVRNAEQDARLCGKATLRHPDGRVFDCTVVRGLADRF